MVAPNPVPAAAQPVTSGRRATQMGGCYWPSRSAQATLLQAHRLILDEDPEIKTAKHALETTMAAVQEKDLPRTIPDPGTGKYIRYQQLIHQIREVVHSALPLDARIAVVSKGDAELLKLGGGRACHFPQTVDGTYAGHYPSNSERQLLIWKKCGAGERNTCFCRARRFGGWNITTIFAGIWTRIIADAGVISPASSTN